MRISFVRYIGAGLATLGLVGMAAAATVTVGTTGPLSFNQTAATHTDSATFNNVSNVMASNGLFQVSTSGTSGVSLSTTGGSALTGAAANNSASSTGVHITTGSSVVGGWGAFSDSIGLDNTGPGSYNQATVSRHNSWSATNVNNITVNNCVQSPNVPCGQWASSGNASSSLNTNGGSASSSAASNSNSDTTSISISN